MLVFLRYIYKLDKMKICQSIKQKKLVKSKQALHDKIGHLGIKLLETPKSECYFYLKGKQAKEAIYA